MFLRNVWTEKPPRTSFGNVLVQWDVVSGLGRLIAGGKIVISGLDTGRLRFQRGFQRVLFTLHQISDEIRIPERIVAAIAARFQSEDLLEDFQVMRDRESVAESSWLKKE